MTRADVLRAGINARIRSEGYDPVEIRPTISARVRAWVRERLIPSGLDIALALSYCDAERIRDHLPNSWIVPTCPRTEPGEYLWPPAKVIVSDNAHFWDARFCDWAASCIERGAKLITCQHGGHTGLARESVWSEWEREIADEFFSWGWGGIGVTPMPSPRLTEIREETGNPDGPILWVWNDNRPQRYARQSCPGPDDWHVYQEWQDRFLAALDDGSRARLVIRPFPQWLGLAKYPEGIPMDDCRMPLVDAMRGASMVIPTHNGTGFLEALACGTPVNAGWYLRADAVSPEGEHWLSVLDDAGMWSGDPLVVARRCRDRMPYDPVARNCFMSRYGMRDLAWPKIWAERIWEIASGVRSSGRGKRGN